MAVVSDAKGDSRLQTEDLLSKLENEELRKPIIGPIAYEGNKTTYLQSLNSFRLQDDCSFCDIVLVVDGDRRFPAHRFILAANSRFFFNLFNSGMKDSSDKELKLHSVDALGMEELLHFFYTRELKVTTDNLSHILETADFLIVSSARNACTNFLTKNLSTDNCLNTRCIASRYHLSELYEKSTNFIHNEFLVIVESGKEFPSMTEQELIDLVSCDEILVSKEEQVFSATLKWVRHDVQNRKKLLARVLEHIRLRYLSRKFIETVLEEEELLVDNSACRQLLQQFLTEETQAHREEEAIAGGMSERPTTKLHDVIIAVGDKEDRVMEILYFDIKEKKEQILWTPFPRNPPVMDPEIVWMNDEIYAIGGSQIYNPHSIFSRESSVNSVWKLSFAQEKPEAKWSCVSSLNHLHGAGAAVAFNGNLYVAGGTTNDDSSSGVHKFVERYIPETDSWQDIASLNTARCELRLVATEDNIYAIGGNPSGFVSARRKPIKTVECYDAASDTWRNVASLKVGRRNAGTAYLHGKIFVIGGMGKNFKLLISCEVYDPSVDRWNFIARIPFHIASSLHTCLLGEEVVQLIPGSTRRDTCDALRYSPTSKAWNKTADFGPKSLISCSLRVVKLTGFQLQSLQRINSNHSTNWHSVISDDDDDDEDDDDDDDNDSGSDMFDFMFPFLF